MHIGGRQGDIAQRRHFEPTAQGRLVQRHRRARIKGHALRIRGAYHRDLLIGEQRRGMTFRAAGDEGTEDIQPLFLGFRQCIGIAVRVLVVAAVQGDKGQLERGYRRVNLVELYLRTVRLEVLRPGLPEQLPVKWDAVQGAYQLLRTRRHFMFIVQRPLHLLFKTAGPRIPEKPLQECHIPQTWRGSPHGLAADTHAAAAAVGKTAVGIMAAGAGHGAVHRQHGIKKQVAPKIDLLRGKPVAVRWQTRLESANAGIFQGGVHLVKGAQPALSSVELKARRAVLVQYDIRRPGQRGHGQCQPEHEQQCMEGVAGMPVQGVHGRLLCKTANIGNDGGYRLIIGQYPGHGPHLLAGFVPGLAAANPTAKCL